MTSAPAAPPVVLFIGGTGRTGSTTVDQLAGQLPRWFSAGEMGWFWELAVGANGRCPCGTTVPDCPVWSEVLADVCADVDATDLADLARTQVDLRRRFWSAHLPLMVLPGFTSRRLAELDDYVAVQRSLYGAIGSVTGADVVVDSAKEPHYGFLLRDGAGLDVRFVHLVRDPRAVGYSWRRRKQEAGLDDLRVMEHRGVLRASLYYLVSNIAAELLWRRRPASYRFLRYEDFVADPAASLRALARFAGDPDADLPPQDADGAWQLDPGATHTAWGNPDRIGRTSIAVREDTAWRRGLGRWQGIALTLANLPLVWRYGYPLRPSGRRRPAPRSRRLARASLGIRQDCGAAPA